MGEGDLELVLFDGEPQVGQQVHLQLVPVKVRHIVAGVGVEHLQHLVHNGGELFRQLVIGLWGELDVAGDEPAGKVCGFPLPQLHPQPGAQPAGEEGGQPPLPPRPRGGVLRGDEGAGGGAAGEHRQVEKQPDVVVFRHGVVEGLPGVVQQGGQGVQVHLCQVPGRQGGSLLAGLGQPGHRPVGQTVAGQGPAAVQPLRQGLDQAAPQLLFPARQAVPLPLFAGDGQLFILHPPAHPPDVPHHGGGTDPQPFRQLLRRHRAFPQQQAVVDGLHPFLRGEDLFQPSPLQGLLQPAAQVGAGLQPYPGVGLFVQPPALGPEPDFHGVQVVTDGALAVTELLCNILYRDVPGHTRQESQEGLLPAGELDHSKNSFATGGTPLPRAWFLGYPALSSG